MPSDTQNYIFKQVQILLRYIQKASELLTKTAQKLEDSSEFRYETVNNQKKAQINKNKHHGTVTDKGLEYLAENFNLDLFSRSVDLLKGSNHLLLNFQTVISLA